MDELGRSLGQAWNVTTLSPPVKAENLSHTLRILDMESGCGKFGGSLEVVFPGVLALSLLDPPRAFHPEGALDPWKARGSETCLPTATFCTEEGGSPKSPRTHRSLFIPAGLHCCCHISSLSGHCCCCPSHRLLKVPPHLPSSPLAPARPPCARGGPWPHATCVCGSGHLHQAIPSGLRSRRQVLPGQPPATPSQALRRVHPHPSTLGLLCGALRCLERMGGTPTLPILDFCPWTMVLAPHGLATPHPNSDSTCGLMEMGSSLEKHLPP